MFGERLQLALKHAKRSRAWLAQKLGVSESAIGLVINGQTKALTAVNAVKAAALLNVSALWLAAGEGEMDSSPATRWRDVARSLATAMDAAERGQRYALFVNEVDKLVERASLSNSTGSISEQQH